MVTVIVLYRARDFCREDLCPDLCQGTLILRRLGSLPKLASTAVHDHVLIHRTVLDTVWESVRLAAGALGGAPVHRNDVHEVFTSLAEVALTSAFVIERSNGDLAAWNCIAKLDAEGEIVIQPFEPVVRRVHANLQRTHPVRADFTGASAVRVRAEGMQWIGPGGTPEILRS